jgi:hypothetical protein
MILIRVSVIQGVTQGVVLAGQTRHLEGFRFCFMRIFARAAPA